ncbi:GSCFA domain-containing protein [Polaribacter sp. KT 15]|uniref:GSCFA domain-containing protein n=1 Tax=Polaribacter sp. KT 15 TaxID=1896175 RepID=UPI00090A1AF0|nr:GSCFA domain-containing protein [Polaribacter sp. KT 15]SHM83991.1 GSCFA family protein [Polaribacter sp. KT 15]
MIFQTQIPIKREDNNLISYHSKALLIGSCFSENIGNKLAFYKFQTQQNPFGILFHPKAIENLISRAINSKFYTENELVYNNERWHCFDAHSSLSASDKKTLLDNLNLALKSTKSYLENASHILVTLGTSWVYRYLENDCIVANCHKIPQKKFSKDLLSVDEITSTLKKITSLIKSINKNANIIFTVSPVRHLKDGFVENNRSKAHLISAVHATVNSYMNSYYFPSYEIVVDELRDYRFYSEDMIHPNNMAINYIWEKFTATWFSEDSKPIMKDVETIQRGIAHRPFNGASEEHQKFLKNLHLKKAQLTKKLPFIKF